MKISRILKLFRLFLTWLFIQAKTLISKIIFKKTIVIIDIEHISFLVFVETIINQLCEDKNLKIFIQTHENDQITSRVSKSEQYPPEIGPYLKGVSLFLSAHINTAGPKNSYRVYMAHNQPVKWECAPKACFTNFDAVFLTSPLHKEKIEVTIEKYELHSKSFDLYETGYPKSDDFFHTIIDRDIFLKDLGFKDTSKKTIMYAPSWEQGLSLRTKKYNILDYLNKLSEKYNIIVKLHPVSLTPSNASHFEFYTGGTEWKNEIISKLSNNVYFSEAQSTTKYMLASDLLITDHSSVSMEFMMIDKPVLFLHCQEFYEETSRSIYSEYGDTTVEKMINNHTMNAGRHAGLVIEKSDEIFEGIEKAINDPDDIRERREEFKKKLIYNKGRATESCLKAIYEIIHNH